jgi:hypothetical protein
MSNYLSATVKNEYFHILPICNLLPYNSSTSGVGSITGNNTTLYSSTALSITIPDYIKDLDVDFISFGANPGSSTALPSNVVVCQIVYNTGFVSGFSVINSAGTSVDLTTQSEYIVEIRVRNGELLPIDIKNIKRIQSSSIGASTTWIAAPTNITLWKRFLKSDSNNITPFMVDNKLPSGPNPTTP